MHTLVSTTISFWIDIENSFDNLSEEIKKQLMPHLKAVEIFFRIRNDVVQGIFMSAFFVVLSSLSFNGKVLLVSSMLSLSTFVGFLKRCKSYF